MNSQKDEHKIHKSACTPASTLGEVPMDTLIHIQSFMDPLDIIALRQSSKTLASATLHRIVWMDALRRVCAGHEVSVLTYPIEKMSLRDLEHAATSPARFIAQISKDWSSRADGGLVPAFSTRLLQPRLPKLTPGHLGELLLMRLVPGGRYLVTTSDIGRMSIWDLGYGPAAILNPYPLLSTVLANTPTQILIQPTKDGKGIRILVYFTVFIQTQITVFEVSPAATQPVFKVVAERRVPSLTINACALTPDRFTYHCDFLITTWNFVEDTSATVHVYQRMLNITVTPTTIIGQHAEGIVVVDIPPLHPTGTPAAEAIVEPITPLPMLSHIHAVLGDVSDLYTTQSDWHSAPDVPIVIDCFGILVDGTNAYARCLIKTVPGEDLDLPCALPVLMGVTRVPPETWEVDFYGRLHFAGTHLVRTWPTGSSVMINVAAVPARRQIVFESKTSLLWEMPPQGELWAYDLDPMSGRFVTLASPTEIRILDYILPNM
ncbi:hypothetical protein C8F04DRAFT_626851 [Mycena alexandri]|uniref:F-box domain-containing protein n=1 Tax=Mycena alexandri TaxID=1745969 RepID=A0AAD6RVV8_9AGAR|nr:hypothetical protein C8F04DRAFT_626851 [Mycena alexandri]